MGQPNSRALLVSGPLRNVSLAYRNSAYIADRVFPLYDSPSPEAKIGRYVKADWFRDEAAIRAPGTRAARGGYKIDTVSINAVEYAFAKEVTEEDIALAKLPGMIPLEPAIDAIEFATKKVDLKKEVRSASLIFNGTWSGDAGGEDTEGLWAAGSGNTFIYDVETAIDYIESHTGYRPNTMWLSSNTLKELKMESTVLDRIKYTQRGVVSAELIAALFGLTTVLVGGAIKNTAEETKAGTEFTASRIWEANAGKGSAMLLYVPPRLGLKTPSAGMQVRVKYPNGQPRSVSTWSEAAEHQDVYEVREKTDILITGADLGKLFIDTITT